MTAQLTHASPKGFKKYLDIILSRYVHKAQYTIGAFPKEQAFHNRIWEWRLKANTYGVVDVTVPDGGRYEPTPYLIISEILNRLELTPTDVYVDLGCGKGRSLLMAARRNIKKVIGVEQDKGFLKIAEENFARLGTIQPTVEFKNCLAQEFDYNDVTIIFMYNPFGGDTINTVLDEIEKTLKTNPRHFRIAYVNPQHDNVLAQREWLEQYDCWHEAEFPDFEVYPYQPRGISFWRYKSD